MNFISEELDDYVCDHTENEPELLYDLNRETNFISAKSRLLKS